MLRRVPRMMGPDWDEMRMSMAPGWDEMQDPDCDKDWTDGSDWETVDEDDMETRTTSEKDRDETDDPDWETMDEDEMETSMTSETVKTGTQTGTPWMRRSRWTEDRRTSWPGRTSL